MEVIINFEAALKAQRRQEEKERQKSCKSFSGIQA